jgi:hypothetical protein
MWCELSGMVGAFNRGRTRYGVSLFKYDYMAIMIAMYPFLKEVMGRDILLNFIRKDMFG